MEELKVESFRWLGIKQANLNSDKSVARVSLSQLPVKPCHYLALLENFNKYYNE